MRYRTILLFGAPGVGKGTQGRTLGHVPGLTHVACGDVFRSLPADSPLGRTFVEYSSRGELVPDHLTIELWERHIESLRLSGAFNPDRDVLLLDGIPRSLTQAKLLAKRIQVCGIFHLICNDRRALHERIRRRALQEGRYDDASETVLEQRLAVFEAETAKTLSYYPDDLIHTINADRSPLRILADMSRMIDRMLDSSDPLPSSARA